MVSKRWSLRFAGPLALAACLWLIPACQITPDYADDEQGQSQTAPAAAPQENELLIKTPSDLPDTYPYGRYLVHLVAIGGVPSLHWRLEKGSLPPGIKLEDYGVLAGAAQRPGEFRFTLSVRDNGSPQQAVEQVFVIRVRTALSLNWKAPAHVSGNRIEGSVEVSNTTPDDIDLTLIVLAVAGNGRATAIGYQHFPLPKGTTEKELPFGETLPRGGYVVHVDAVGEVIAKKVIYRERMQTPGPLQVTVGP